MGKSIGNIIEMLSVIKNEIGEGGCLFFEEKYNVEALSEWLNVFRLAFYKNWTDKEIDLVADIMGEM